jgi:hypothetical protein
MGTFLTPLSWWKVRSGQGPPDGPEITPGRVVIGPNGLPVQNGAGLGQDQAGLCELPAAGDHPLVRLPVARMRA